MNNFTMPRSPRLLAPWVGTPGAGSAIYHCISRVVNREHVFKDREKEKFVELMRNYERFCGVRILTYSVMSNHFHLEVEVPPRPQEPLSDEQLFERMMAIYSEAEVRRVRRLLEQRHEVDDIDGAEAIREKYLYRMWNLSEFMKTLKQCFTRWFNRRHDRRGTLWEERFKSVLVEEGHAARVVGAYIDLNPLRAKMVNRPEDYQWCGFGEASAGNPVAQAGLVRLMAHYRHRARDGEADPDWESALREYRTMLYCDGEEQFREDERDGRVVVARAGISREEVERVVSQGGKLSVAEMLHCRVRALTEGAVVGLREFVDDFFEARRELFGTRRTHGAHPIHGCETELCTLMEVRDEPIR